MIVSLCPHMCRCVHVCVRANAVEQCSAHRRWAERRAAVGGHRVVVGAGRAPVRAAVAGRAEDGHTPQPEQL